MTSLISMDAAFNAIAAALSSARAHAAREREAALMLATDREAELSRREVAWENRYAQRSQILVPTSDKRT
jgi:hypothetical protein